HAALDHVGHETPMREELRDAVRGLLTHPPGRAHPVDAEVKDRLAALGRYVALARSPVDRDQQGEIRLLLDPQAPTRLVKMLAEVWGAAGQLGLGRRGGGELVRRNGMDSIPKLGMGILEYLNGSFTTASTADVAEAVEPPSRTTRRALEDLTAHRVVRRL